MSISVNTSDATIAYFIPGQEDSLLIAKEVQDYLRISRATMYRLIGSGQLPVYYVGATMRFYRSDVQKCVRRI